MAEDSRKHPDDEFYAWIGRCINRWSYVDQHLFGICHTILGMSEPPYRRLAAVIYFRTPSIEARLSLVSDLLHAAIYPQGKKPGQHDLAAIKQWKKVQTDIRDLLPQRNFIAHNPVKHDLFAIRNGERTPIPKANPHVYQHWDDRGRKTSAIDRMGVAELKAHNAALDPVMTALLEVWREIETQLKERD